MLTSKKIHGDFKRFSSTGESWDASVLSEGLQRHTQIKRRVGFVHVPALPKQRGVRRVPNDGSITAIMSV